jgi:hypothetical protein
MEGSAMKRLRKLYWSLRSRIMGYNKVNVPLSIARDYNINNGDVVIISKGTQVSKKLIVKIIKEDATNGKGRTKREKDR